MKYLHSFIRHPGITMLLLFFLTKVQVNVFAQTYVGSTTQGRSSAGNLIFNNGFETPDAQGYPTDVSQVNHLQSWEDRAATSSHIHSPDWVYSGLGSAYNPVPTPVSGKGMIGMSNYELIQQGFRNQDMKGGEYYVVSMYIYLYSFTSAGTIDNSRIKCYLAHEGVKYKSENDISAMCSQPYMDYKQFPDGTNVIQEIASWDLNLSTYPNTNGWAKITKVFRAPKDNGVWKYFMIDLREINHNSIDCHDGYVFIDEVSVEEVDQCGKTCSPNLGAIQYTTMPNAIVANDAPGFTMLIKDAMGINFTVFDRWGNEIYNQNAYDPNGLKDVNYPDYYFSWTGQKPDGSLFPQDVYVYTLRLWNCKYDQTYTKSLTYLIGNGSATQGYDFHNTTLINCCPQYLQIQDKEYFSDATIEKAVVSITAGRNFTTAFPIGPVVCHSGSDVKYVSAAINLLPGFSVEPGAKFQAIYTGICSDQLIHRTSEQVRNRPDFKIKQVYGIENSSYFVSPNPNNGSFTISSESENEKDIFVYDMMGKIVFEKTKTKEQMLTIDLKDPAKGIYLVKVLDGNDQQVQKIVVQ